MERQPRSLDRLARIGGAAVLVTAGAIAGDMAPRGDMAEAEAMGNIRRVSSETQDAWYPLVPGETLIVKANAVVIPADVEVDGVPQYDNDADTSTVIGVFSEDREKIRVTNQYGGSIHVLRSGTTRKQFFTDLGDQSWVLERRNSPNNPTKRVNLNVIKK